MSSTTEDLKRARADGAPGNTEPRYVLDPSAARQPGSPGHAGKPCAAQPRPLHNPRLPPGAARRPCRPGRPRTAHPGSRLVAPQGSGLLPSAAGLAARGPDLRPPTGSFDHAPVGSSGPGSQPRALLSRLPRREVSHGSDRWAAERRRGPRLGCWGPRMPRRGAAPTPPPRLSLPRRENRLPSAAAGGQPASSERPDALPRPSTWPVSCCQALAGQSPTDTGQVAPALALLETLANPGRAPGQNRAAAPG